MEENKKCLIPRNLNYDDIVKIGFGIKLKVLDLPILGGGGGLAYFLTQNHDNFIIKTVTYASLLGVSLIVTQLKFEDQNSPELLVNTTIYHGRKIHYKKIKGGNNNEATIDSIQESNKHISNKFFVQKS